MLWNSSKSKKTKTSFYIVSLIKKVIIIFLGLLISILTSRYLGPEKKGLVTIVTNYSRIATVILAFGQTVIYPYIRKSKREYESSQVISICFLEVIILFFSIVVYIITTNNLLKMTLLLIPFELLCEQCSGITMIQDYKTFSIISIISYIINTVFCLFLFVFLEPNEWMIMISFIIKYLFTCICCFNIIRNNTSWNKFTVERSLYCFKLGFVPMITALLGMINYQIDVIMMDWFKIEYFDIGLYSTAVLVSQMVCMVPDAFKEALASKNTEKDAKNDVSILCRLSFTIAVICIVGALALGKLGLRIAFGEEYVGAYIPMIILLIGNIPMVYFKLIGVFYQSNGKFLLHFMTLLSSAVANIVMNIFMIPLYGIIGAGFSSVVSYLVAGGVYIFFMGKDYGVRFRDFIFIKKEDINHFRNFINNRKEKRT